MYLDDYVINTKEEEQLNNLIMVCGNGDHLNYDEAVKHEKWRQVMDQETQ